MFGASHFFVMLVLFLLWMPTAVTGFVGIALKSSSYSTSTNSCLYNLFTDIGDALTGGKLVDQSDAALPYGKALGEPFETRRRLAIQERAISFTGEDFDIFDLDIDQGKSTPKLNRQAQSQWMQKLYTSSLLAIAFRSWGIFHPLL